MSLRFANTLRPTVLQESLSDSLFLSSYMFVTSEISPQCDRCFNVVVCCALVLSLFTAAVNQFDEMKKKYIDEFQNVCYWMLLPSSSCVPSV